MGGRGGQNGLHRVIFYDLHFFNEDKTVDDFEEVLFILENFENSSAINP